MQTSAPDTSTPEPANLFEQLDSLRRHTLAQMLGFDHTSLSLGQGCDNHPLFSGFRVALKQIAPLPSGFTSSQSLQPFGVSGPVGGAAGGNAPLVVNLYSLGAGVTLAGESSDLHAREGAFELEANGKVFVIDPLRARPTHGLVAPVQGHIRAVWHTVKAKKQKNHTKLGDSNPAAHSDSPGVETAILSLPQGMGKTTMAPALAARLGCTSVVDEWLPGIAPVTPGGLHLTQLPIVAWNLGAAA